MRRSLLILTLTTALLGSATPAQAATVDGHLIASTAGSNGYSRCAFTLSQAAGDGSAGNGTIYWHVPATPGTHFTLTPTGPTAPAMELAVAFYSVLGDCALAPPEGGTHNERGLGEAESGIVPPGTRYALVLMTAGVPGSTFRWTN